MVISEGPNQGKVLGKKAIPDGFQPSTHRALSALDRVAFKEQRLADQRGYRGLLVRLGNKKRWFRPLAGEEALRVGGNEDHRNLERGEEVVDSFQSRAPVGKLNICEDEAGALLSGQRDCLCPRSRNPDGAVAEALDDVFEIERYKSLILNDQYIRGNLGREFTPGLLHELLKCLPIDIENRGGLFLGEGFERHQQKGLPRHCRDLSETTVRRCQIEDRKSVVQGKSV